MCPSRAELNSTRSLLTTGVTPQTSVKVPATNLFGQSQGHCATVSICVPGGAGPDRDPMPSGQNAVDLECGLLDSIQFHNAAAGKADTTQ